MRNIRNDFPILKTKIKNKPLIFLDNAATSQKPKEVIEAVADFYRTYNSNIYRGIYKIAEKATKEYEKTRKSVAQFIGTKDSSEIIFTSGTTESINLAALSWGEKNVRPGDDIITTVAEHHSNFVPWQQLAKRKRANFLVAPISQDGQIDLSALLKLVSKKTRLVALSYVSNVLGTINPVKKIIQEIRNRDPKIKILIDGAQAVPYFSVDVKDIDCDFFAFSGHKMLGPDGIGVLYAKKTILNDMPPMLTGGHMIKDVSIKNTLFNDIPWRFEAGTRNIAGTIGLGSAINYINNVSLKRINIYLQELTKYALSRLQAIPGLTIYGPQSHKERISLASFNIKGVHPHDLAQFLDRDNICIRAGHHCALPLHRSLGIEASARASFYAYNTQKEVDALVNGLIKAKKFFSI